MIPVSVIQLSCTDYIAVAHCSSTKIFNLIFLQNIFVSKYNELKKWIYRLVLYIV